jgi:hypothetical protein
VSDIRPTGRLRFIERDGKKILQQEFEHYADDGETEDGGTIIDTWGEHWRDVPFGERNVFKMDYFVSLNGSQIKR